MEAISEELQRLKEIIDRITPMTDEEERAHIWKTVIMEHLSACRLPDRFWYRIAPGDWNCLEQESVYRSCSRLLAKRGAIIALIGERGTGKTTICSQIIIDRAENPKLLPWHRRPPYRKLVDLIAIFKPIYSDFGTIRAEELIEYRDEFCKSHPLLIIDEVGDCDDLKMKDRILTDILDRRYSAMTSTILISNQKREQFDQTTSESVLSRISEHGRIIACEWRSWREGDAKKLARNGANNPTP